MDLNTKGRTTSEFTLTLATLLAGGIAFGLKSWFNWELSEEETAMVSQLSTAVVGLVISYTLGRSFFKGQKARALGHVANGNGNGADAAAAALATLPPKPAKKK